MNTFFSSIVSFIRKVIFSLAAVFLLYGHASNSFAGYRDDRLVVWFNLEGNSDRFNVDGVIENLITSRRVDSECGVHWRGSGSTLYMKNRPEKITNHLIHSAFIDKNKASLRRLNHLLKAFRSPEDGIKKGLDGVMLYSNKNDPHMMNFITNQEKIKTYPLTSNGSTPTTQNIEDAFCILLPPTTRAP